MKSRDDLGDRMKDYEVLETSRRFHETLPIYARIDGRTFSKFTEGMARPFDSRMSQAMIDVTLYIVEETDALVGYTQSDEISLVWKAADYNKRVLFAGRTQKLVSSLASMASAKLSHCIRGWSPYEDRLPSFDCRVIQLPHDHEVANMFLWRTLDARRNAVTSTCRSLYSPDEMHRKTVPEMLDMIELGGVNFDEYPEHFRLGTFLRRETYEKRTETGRIVTRRQVRPLSLPPFLSVINRTEFLMEGAKPLVST